MPILRAPGHRQPLAPDFALHGPDLAQEQAGEELVRQMVDARQRRQPLALPPDAGRSMSPRQAYALQEQHARLLLPALGGRVIGLRIAVRDMAALAALGLGGPMRGPIFSGHAHGGPATLQLADHLACRIELAIAVRLREDIGGHPYLPGRDVLLHAIDAVMPAIDVVDSRLSQPLQRPPSLVLADLNYGGAWVHGDAVRDWQDIDFATLPVRLSANGQEKCVGQAAPAGVDPLQALGLLVADLGRDARPLRAGDVVSMGPCTAAYVPAADDLLRADFGPLGSVELHLA